MQDVGEVITIAEARALTLVERESGKPEECWRKPKVLLGVSRDGNPLAIKPCGSQLGLWN